MAGRKVGLGKGLDSLITGEDKTSAKPKVIEKVVEKIADYYDLVPGWALKEIIEIIKSSGIR